MKKWNKFAENKLISKIIIKNTTVNVHGKYEINAKICWTKTS